MSVVLDVPASGFFARSLRRLSVLVLGGLACTNPITALLALGWMQSMARGHAKAVARQAVLSQDRATWFMGAKGGRFLSRLCGGLAQNMRRGVHGLIVLLALSLPFSVAWIVSWGAGWENSFNKGYEQAHLGPLIAMAGVALCLGVLVYLPMALAHQAVEDRLFAGLDLGRVRQVVAHTGWGYVAFAFVSVLAFVPLFGVRSLVVFGEGIYPNLVDFTPDQIAALKVQIALASGVYVFCVMALLRRWAAGIYARAVLAAWRQDVAQWDASPLLASGGGTKARTRSYAVVRGVRVVVMMVIWFGLVAQIFVGQFMNHDWHLWLTHPAFLLPWAG